MASAAGVAATEEEIDEEEEEEEEGSQWPLRPSRCDHPEHYSRWSASVSMASAAESLRRDALAAEVGALVSMASTA